MRGTGERYNNVWPRSASGVLPPKKPRGMQGMLREKKKRGRRKEEEKRREERRAEERRGEERGERVTSPCSRIAKAGLRSRTSSVQSSNPNLLFSTVTVLRNQSASLKPQKKS